VLIEISLNNSVFSRIEIKSNIIISPFSKLVTLVTDYNIKTNYNTSKDVEGRK